MPAAKAPTIADKPNEAASAEAPKHAAVAAASIGPSDLPLERKLIMRGRMMAKNTVKQSHSASDHKITSATPNAVMDEVDDIKETMTPG
jgi:hypothetical protein